jgi:hypothetical protein
MMEIVWGRYQKMTTLYFEVFAPGMRAKLDPTFRHAYEGNHLPDRAEILGKIARNSQQSFIPFTTVRKASDFFGR